MSNRYNCVRMYVFGFFVAEYREAEEREAEGYHCRLSDENGFRRLCRYDQSPKDSLQANLPEDLKKYVTWSDGP